MPPEPDTPAEDPDWAFGMDQDIHCPDCDALLEGLDWVMGGDAEAVRATGMDLRPCHHVLSTTEWELRFSGSDRKLGHRIKTPRFERKGSQS